MAATARDIMERIARSVHATEALSPFASFGATTLDGERSVDDRDGHHAWVRVTGGVDGDGHYPGLWCQYDPTTNVLTDQAQAILVREVMGGTLKQTNTAGATVYYWGRMEGDFSSTAVFAVKSESSTSTPVTGTTDYGTSGAAGTSPPGVLSPPTLTVAGPPSWTPAANTYPLEWDKFSGTLYIWNGTTWTEIGCGCTAIAFSVKGNPTGSTATFISTAATSRWRRCWPRPSAGPAWTPAPRPRGQCSSPPAAQRLACCPSAATGRSCTRTRRRRWA